MMPNVDEIVRYEAGEMAAGDEVAMFAGLIRSGVAWSLQGHYGRTAAALIEGGYIEPNGEITADGRALIEEAF